MTRPIVLLLLLALAAHHALAQTTGDPTTGSTGASTGSTTGDPTTGAAATTAAAEETTPTPGLATSKTQKAILGVGIAALVLVVLCGFSILGLLYYNRRREEEGVMGGGQYDVPLASQTYVRSSAGFQKADHRRA